MYWQRRPTGQIYIYRYIDGKVKSLSRKESKHLDGQEDAVVEHFVQSLRPKKTVERPLINQRLDDLVGRFLMYLSKRGGNPSTINMKRISLIDHILPYFIKLDALDPNTWAQHSVALLEYLESEKFSPHLIVRGNTALKQFWKWMQDEQLVSRAVEIPLRRPVFKTTVTPLQFTLTPEEVLAFAKSQTDSHIAFLALAGFFFSLRTQEVLALTRSDFLAGSSATGFEACRVMAKHNLFSKFAVNITKQNSKSLKDVKATPKAGSKGIVACFNGEAAKMLVGLIKTLGETSEDRPLIPFSIDYNMKRWSAYGIPGITLKDLRRASIYWLGHHTSLGFIELRSHARHKDESTTLLYLRRPEETFQESYDLDLEA